MSHVVGNVTIPLNAGVAIRYEYPVGSLTNYRKAVVEFPSGILTPSPLTIKYLDQAPGGENGLTINGPITVFPGISIDSTANFSWLVKSAISMGISQTFNLELYAEGWGLFQDVDSTLNLLRAIRRLDTGVQNPWTPQTGTYSNFVTSLPTPYPVLRVTATTGGIVHEGSHFTFGLEKQVLPVNVSGTVTYDNADSTPMEGVVVSIGGKQDTTAADGTFSIADVASGTYTLSASSTATPPALLASDALAVANNFAGISTPYTPLTGLKLEAADVNNSGIANNTDALLILYRTVNAEQVFTKGNWVFTSQSITVSGADVSANLKGLAVGDVVPGTPALAKASSVKLDADGVLKVNPKDAFVLPINVLTDMKVSAMTLKFSYPSDLVTFEGISSKTDGIISDVKDGIVSIAWADLSGKGALDLKTNESLISLKFTPTENFKAGSKLDVTLDGACELVDKDGNVIAATLKAAAVEGYVPTEFALRQNYPNPFNPSTTIQYDLPVDARVNIVVYNSLAQQVVTLVNQEQSAGVYKVNFNASGLTSGIYFYRINVQGGERNYTQTHKMILMK